jgi:two-component system chemotaxis sensor kinase CheA
MDDLLSEFLTETSEGLATLDLELVRLEQNPNNPALLSNIFRIVHTIKGTCGFLGLPRLEAVAHASENVLGRIRDGEITISAFAISLILTSLDRIKMILATLEATEAEPPGDDKELIERLNAFAEGRISADEAPAAVEAPVAEPPKAEKPAKGKAKKPSEEEPAAAAPEPEPQVPAPVAKSAPDLPAVQAPAAPPAPSAPAQAEHRETTPAEIKDSSVAASNIRVNVDLLENLMTMVSELVLTRNQLMQILRGQKDSEFLSPLQRLSHVTTELQEGVMKTRMQPIGNAWGKLPRLVRDLALELHKKIDLQMKGAETELDRQVLELIKDPLTHMVRNSADHGIEMPAERVAAGKSESGTITLNAFHEGGHIIIEIGDDGKGLDSNRIKQKAIQNGLATEADIAQMSEQQIYQFIFKPGFSTAAAVTSVSGRGVGMDVVRTNIEKIGGAIELKSQFGRGSTFVIKIPLTLAIVSALIVECAGERFAVPQISVVELVRAAPGTDTQIERLHGTPVLRLRNRLLPLVALDGLLRLERDGDAPTETFIVVTQVGTYTFGIMVDRVFDTEEIVVKPVAPILRDITMFSGNTILGDGAVIMILDPNGIAAATGEITVGEQQVDQVQHKSAATKGNQQISLLLFSVGDGTAKAVPLGLVARLEEIDSKEIEFSTGRPLVQYRGKLMPLVPIDPHFELKREGLQPLLVFSDQNRSMGLLVSDILDIVEDTLNIELGSERPGTLGSAIIAGRATDVIDTGYYLMQAYEDWFTTQEADVEAQLERAKRVLLVDDSPFFRNLLTPLLAVAGYNVSAVESADEALALYEHGEDFDIIVSDIEMPGTNGFDFARLVRESERWHSVPMVALSSHTSRRDLDRGREVGFNDYIAKFDRDALLNSISASLNIYRGAAE